MKVKNVAEFVDLLYLIKTKYDNGERMVKLIVSREAYNEFAKEHKTIHQLIHVMNTIDLPNDDFRFSFYFNEDKDEYIFALVKEMGSIVRNL